MREDREIVLSEQEIQDICNDIGKKLSKDLENEERTPLFLNLLIPFIDIFWFSNINERNVSF